MVALAVKLSTDYDHSANFVGIKHIPGNSWSKVEAVNSIWDARVKSAVDKELAWQQRAGLKRQPPQTFRG